MTKRWEIEDQSYDLYLRRMNLFQRKNEDYADEDALSNFKRVAAVCKIWGVDVSTPSGVADLYIVMKFDRYFNLKRQGKTPKNESLDDTFLDVFNYLDLNRAILMEKNGDDA